MMKTHDGKAKTCMHVLRLSPIHPILSYPSSTTTRQNIIMVWCFSVHACPFGQASPPGTTPRGPARLIKDAHTCIIHVCMYVCMRTCNQTDARACSFYFYLICILFFFKKKTITFFTSLLICSSLFHSASTPHAVFPSRV